MSNDRQRRRVIGSVLGVCSLVTSKDGTMSEWSWSYIKGGSTLQTGAGWSERLMKTWSWWTPRVGWRTWSTSPKLLSSVTNWIVCALTVSRCKFTSPTITHPAKDDVAQERQQSWRRRRWKWLTQDLGGRRQRTQMTDQKICFLFAAL